MTDIQCKLHVRHKTGEANQEWLEFFPLPGICLWHLWLCCFKLTRVSSTMCLLRENPLSTSAYPWLIHNAALTTSIRLMYFGLTRPSFCLATCDQYSSTDATWPSADSIHSGDQHPLDTISIWWTWNQENSSYKPREAQMRPVCWSFECCLDCYTLRSLSDPVYPS